MNRIIGAAAAVLALHAAPLAAQSATEAEPANSAQITVYGWMAGATGEFRPFAGAPTVEFDNSFGEVL